jgi:hypothetical protein
MNDFDLRKYLKNNLLLESKEYEKEMDDDQDDDSVPYIDGKPVEEVELSANAIQPVNAEVKDGPTLAKAVLDFINQAMEKESFKLDSSNEIKIAVTNLKAVAAKASDYASKDMAKDQKGNDPTAGYEEKNASMNEEDSPMNDPRTEQIIQMLKDMDVDGETMEHILRQVGMDDQMANQLVNNPAEYEDEVSRAVGESRELRGMAEEELHADSSTVHINGRAVDINSLAVDGVDPQDRPDFVDAYFVSGDYMDGTELSDEELEYLWMEYPEIVNDLANQY